MKAPINLLPTEARQERMQKVYLRRFKAIYTSVCVAIVIIAIGYGAEFGYFMYANNIAQKELSAVDAEAGNTMEETQEINRVFSATKARLVDKRTWLPDIAEALRLAPSGIKITGISVDPDKRDEKKVLLAITGVSNSRSATLQYQQRLQEVSWIQDLEAPLQNFASGPGVEFTFTITRKP